MVKSANGVFLAEAMVSSIAKMVLREHTGYSIVLYLYFLCWPGYADAE